MKRLFTLGLAVATLLSASAAAPKSVHNALPFQAKHEILGKVKGTTPAKALNKVQSRTGDTPIFNPEGEVVSYMNRSMRYVNTWWGLTYDEGATPTQVVFGEDNIVYICNVITSLPSGVFVEGYLEDGKITVELPQVAYSQDGDDYMASKMEYYEYEYEGETYIGYRNVKGDDNFVVYNIDDDGTITLDLNDGDPLDYPPLPQYIIGLCSDTREGYDDWYGYGEAYQTLTKIDLTPVTIPEGVELEEWAILSNSGNATAMVGFDGNDVYVTDFVEGIEDITFKGTIDGDKIHFECGQYMGMFDTYYLFLTAVEWEDENWEDYTDLEVIDMDYDAEKKMFAVNNPLIDLLVNISDSGYDPMYYYENPTFLYQTAEDTNANPEDPYVAYFDDYAYRSYNDTYEGYIEWNIPAVNVKGFMLNTDAMYYHFLIDNEVKTFTVDEYPLFEEDVTDIPYELTDGYDLQVIDESHYITFKTENYKSFGLQSFYVGSDGETYSSNLVTYYPESGIADIDTNKAIKSVEFFNLQGQKVLNPEAGIYVVRATYADGTTSVSKVAKK